MLASFTPGARMEPHPRFRANEPLPIASSAFSNFLIGLIEGSSAVGLFPGTKDLAFVERCRSFLVHQVQVVRPSLLLVLGIHTPRLLAGLSPVMAHWQNARTFSD